MDLFHTITQEIENVLSCHWLSEFRDSHRSASNSTTNSSSNSRSNSTSPSASGSRSASVAASPLRRSSSSSSIASSAPVSVPSSPILSAVASQGQNKSKMSDQLMDTEPGGEQTQYESIQTVTKPPNKEEGQLGGECTMFRSLLVFM